MPAHRIPETNLVDYTNGLLRKAGTMRIQVVGPDPAEPGGRDEVAAARIYELAVILAGHEALLDRERVPFETLEDNWQHLTGWARQQHIREAESVARWFAKKTGVGL